MQKIDLSRAGDIYLEQFGVCFSGFGIKMDVETELLRTISIRETRTLFQHAKKQRKYLEKESQKTKCTRVYQTLAEFYTNT